MQSAAPIRIASEIGPAKKCSEPPAAIQNAMMTKDKKPFTYTPGGLDLAEIRSPRMARRINRNAHMEDSCSGPQLKAPGPPVQPHSLPPAALAAMQPQIAIPVFPPGNDASPRAHHTSPPSSSGSPPPIPSVGANTGVPPPPPPPPPMLPVGGSVGSPPPPPPPMPDGSISPQMHSTQGNNNNQQTYRPKNGNHSPPTYLQDIQNRPALRPVGQPGQNRPPPDFVSEIPCHSPLRPVNHPPRSSYEPSNASPIQVQLKPVSPKSSQAQSPSHSSPPYVPQQPTIPNQYRNQESSNPAQTLPKPAQDMYPQKQTQQSTKPSVYIPPRQSSPPNVTPIRQTPPSPAALNKAPAPWMTSRQVQKDSPPWAVRQGTPEDKGTPPPVSSGTPMTRVIPIQIEGREPTPNYQQQMAQQMQQMQIQAQRQMQQQQLNQIPHYATLPKQSHSFSRQDSSSSISSQSQQQQQGRTRIIPIQIEGGTSSETTNQQKTYNTQQSFTNHNASPVAFGQNRFQNSAQGPGLQRTSSVDTTDNKNRQLQSQVSWTQGGSNPIQSRSFRVLQKITGSEDQPSAPINQSPTGETYLVNRVLPNREGNLFNWCVTNIFHISGILEKYLNFGALIISIVGHQNSQKNLE
ncbi:hypothetical protein O3M35_008799 [Rhynocoris fuscipes]|uniref:Uncharacterized protein n=1 Tax=Rhynocoris fuscipes TaxID=488301 RepID=A0AAW1D7F8_9HEMI